MKFAITAPLGAHDFIFRIDRPTIRQWLRLLLWMTLKNRRRRQRAFFRVAIAAVDPEQRVLFAVTIMQSSGHDLTEFYQSFLKAMHTRQLAKRSRSHG